MRKLILVVEGHSEVLALPVLARRILEDLHRFDIHIPEPVRVPRDRFLRRPEEFSRTIGLASAKAGSDGVILVLMDADDDCPKELRDLHLENLLKFSSPLMTGLVFANREIEAWLLANMESIAGHRGINAQAQSHSEPENPRDAKGWLKLKMTPGRTYSPTIDLPKFFSQLDWKIARTRSPSLDKFCRELEKLTQPILV